MMRRKRSGNPTSIMDVHAVVLGLDGVGKSGMLCCIAAKYHCIIMLRTSRIFPIKRPWR